MIEDMKIFQKFKNSNNKKAKAAQNINSAAGFEDTLKTNDNPTQGSIEKKENKEAVEETIKELKAEKMEIQNKRPVKLSVLMYAFFPVTLFSMLIIFIAKKIKIPITVKMLLTLGTMFLFLIGAFSFFIITSLKNTLEPSQSIDDLINNLIVSSIILIAVFTVVFIALITVSSALFLNPIRKMTAKVNSITTENLSERLEIIDTQDELMELTDCINGMLSNIEESFMRQQNFVADASHELKTPIAVIQGYANMLKRWGKDDPEILQEGITSIHRESENMKRIVEQLLILARLGKMSINRTVFSLSEAMKSIVESYRVMDLNHEFRLKIEEEIDLNTDKNMLLESIRTLIDNAVKYTPAGGIVTITCESDETSVRVSIEDTGIGISQEDLPKIFDRFFRCDKSRGREKGSSGLGLTIAKSIVETLGGQIYVSSTPNVGSIFTIELF